MSKAILMIDMPSCYSECFALDDNGDYYTRTKRIYIQNKRA